MYNVKTVVAVAFAGLMGLSSTAMAGMVCTIEHLPNPNARYMMNIRVSNNSAVGGKLMGELDANGRIIWSGELDDNIHPNATFYFSNKEMAKISGKTWESRATLKISTSLPEIKVKAIWSQKMDYGPGEERQEVEVSCTKETTNDVDDREEFGEAGDK